MKRPSISVWPTAIGTTRWRSEIYARSSTGSNWFINFGQPFRRGGRWPEDPKIALELPRTIPKFHFPDDSRCFLLGAGKDGNGPTARPSATLPERVSKFSGNCYRTIPRIRNQRTLAAVYGDLGQNLLDSGEFGRCVLISSANSPLMPEDYQAHQSLGDSISDIGKEDR